MSEASDEDTTLLRFSTAGSVDDGKSTLIGRLLYETKQIYEDQLASVERASQQQGAEYLNLALLTDGLRAEREQGITIDVAYRYFATPTRKFIIADTPGHLQYTRNMVTGTSTADAAVVLVDARNGVVEQSRRHAFIASLLRVPHLIVCVNKMDLVNYDQAVFERIRDEFQAFAAQLDDASITFIPLSALNGDNVVDPSSNMPWYRGPTLLRQLESVEVASTVAEEPLRFPVQWVVRPYTSGHDYRAYAGQVAAGVVHPGDAVRILPRGLKSRVRSVDTYDGPLAEAFPPLSVALRLEDDLDVSRGDMICGLEDQPAVTRDITATLCWLNEQPMAVGSRCILRHTTRGVRARIEALEFRIDVNSLEHDSSASTLALNDIGQVRILASGPIFADTYARSRATGSFVLIDQATDATVAAGLIVSART